MGRWEDRGSFFGREVREGDIWIFIWSWERVYYVKSREKRFVSIENSKFLR